jgi:hypothetical protein
MKCGRNELTYLGKQTGMQSHKTVDDRQK